MTTCDRIDDLRDYAMGELPADACGPMERHIAGCGECATELESLRLTTATLRTVVDREIPQRIGFVSDKIFEPSPAARWFAGFWNSAARLGFASACMLSAALVILAYRPAAPAGLVAGAGSSVRQASLSRAEVEQEINQAVSKAVERVRAEDAETSARTTAAALAVAEEKHEKEHRALLVAMDENLTVLQKRLSTYTMLASSYDMNREAGRETGRIGDGR